MSDEDLEAEENEFGSLEEESPPEDSFLHNSMLSTATSMPTSNPGMYQGMHSNMGHSSQMIQPQLLQQHM